MYGCTLINELSSTSNSLVYSVKSPTCLFTRLSGFLVMLAAYSRDFSIFLSSGEVQIPDFGCFRWAWTESLQDYFYASIVGSVYYVLVIWFSLLVDCFTVIHFCSNEISMYFYERSFVASPYGVTHHFHNIEDSC